MRVIAGTLKGRRLKAPDWPGLRPTSDRLRETLFDVLADRVAGARVLDGYAGTGAVGIEALSRGARHVVFVERDSRAVRLIQQNVRACGVSDGCAIVARAIEEVRSGAASGPFDLVFLDPPYDAPGIPEALDLTSRWLAPDGLLVLEHSARRDSPQHALGVSRVRKIVAGDSALSFYRAARAGTACAREGGDS